MLPPQTGELYLEDKQVHKLALEILVKSLGLQMDGREYQAEEISEILLAAAAKQSSIEQICRSSELAPSGNTVRGIIREQFNIEQAERTANQMLGENLPKSLKKRAKRCAADLVLIPYHGQAEKEESEVSRGQAKSGTTHFHAYASAFIVERGQRYTLALTFVRATDELTGILSRLRNRVAELGIRVKCWLLDREFFNVEVIRELKQQGMKFIMPVIIRGKEDPPGGTRALLVKKQSHWTHYTLNSPKYGSISFKVAVVAKNYAGNFNRCGRNLLAFAVYGIRATLPMIAQIYRTRFGIETSHRQMNQGRAKTCSRSPVLRLLFVAIAFLLRNLWAWLHWAVLALPRQGQRKLRLACLSLSLMLNWIATVTEEHLIAIIKIKAEFPIP
jgi:putative transposase